MGKFRMPDFLLTPKPRVAHRGVPRAKDLVLRSSYVKKRVVIKKGAAKKKKDVAQKKHEPKPTTRTVVDWLLKAGKNKNVQPERPRDCPDTSEPKEPIKDNTKYIEQLQRDIVAGRWHLRGNPWVIPRHPFQEAIAINKQRINDGERHIDAAEALNLVLRPSVFVWAPTKLFPGTAVCCPGCKMPSSCMEWARPRILHSLNGHCTYIASRHICYQCQSTFKHTTPLRQRAKKTFMADAPEVLASLPSTATCLWDFVNTGRTLCDASVMDLVRALATRTSWAAIADTINELKQTAWVKTFTLRYLKLCEVLHITPKIVPSAMPAANYLQDEWLRDLFMSDSEGRRDEVNNELEAEKGDAVLMLDWTKDAALRCQASFLFNAMSGGGKLLLSALTSTSGPHEVQPLLVHLKRRGVHPKVVYVDDGCCGVWKSVLECVWPGVLVRLDGMHAIMRLTQTTTSTQHPWHGHFCAMLSAAFYRYDQGETERLRKARVRAGFPSTLPKKLRSMYVPRVIADVPHILASVSAAIAHFHERAHEDMGQLLTPATLAAWANLKEHVEAGCVSDPQGIELNVLQEQLSITIGGEQFRPVRTMRGSSALEGFHTHQKQWLGHLAHHTSDAGRALLADGGLRWNRKQHNKTTPETTRMPFVFAGGLLQTADDLHQHLVGERLYPALIKSASAGAGSASGVPNSSGHMVFTGNELENNLSVGSSGSGASSSSV